MARPSPRSAPSTALRPSLLLTLFGAASALSAAVGCASTSEIGDDPASVLEADHARSAAMVEADAEALDARLHSSLTYIHSTGSVDGKRALIDTLLSGRIDYQLIDSPESRARLFEEVAIVSGPVHMRVRADHRTHEIDSVYTAVYWWRAERWQLVAYQSSRSDRSPAVESKAAESVGPTSIEEAGRDYLRKNAAPEEIEREWNAWVNETGTAVWERPGLTRAERSLITIGILSVLREQGPLRVHVEAGLANGLTRSQISEAIMHTAVYAGIPQALRSMVIAREVFDRLDTLP